MGVHPKLMIFEDFKLACYAATNSPSFENKQSRPLRICFEKYILALNYSQSATRRTLAPLSRSLTVSEVTKL